MSNLFAGNWIGVRPGDPAFNVLSNMCDYFEIGQRDGDDVWLEGQIVQGEFIFNGRLYLQGGQMGTVIDNFPKGPVQNGWSQRRRLDGDGYELLDQNGERVFAYQIRDNVCLVDMALYNATGELAAHSGQGGFVVHVKPVRMGRHGIVVG